MPATHRFIVTVALRALPEHAEALRAALARQAANSLAREEACHAFEVSVDPEAPHAFFLYEKYSDAAAFDEHLRSEHFLAFDLATRDWLEAKEVRTWISL
ncbi:MAG: antibiotic biosynthesis monooxygenase, partial [Acidobacteriota bacterium]